MGEVQERTGSLDQFVESFSMSLCSVVEVYPLSNTRVIFYKAKQDQNNGQT